jgi:hypothetical protein
VSGVLDEATRQQIEALTLRRDRPLVICDVDEVVVHFLRGLEAHLAENGCWLDPASFALNGNIRWLADNEPVTTIDLAKLLFGCFAARTRGLEAIEGAAQSLAELSAVAEIVMLTNLPREFLDDRRHNLARHGMNYPIVANSGPKGPAVARLAERAGRPVVFIDDNSGYLHSAYEALPSAALILFLQDQRFARHAPTPDWLSLRAADWPTAAAHIRKLIETPP